MPPMLSRNRIGRRHARDCWCCNDGFWGLNWRQRNKVLRRINRKVEKERFRRSLKEGTE